jgi:hypothetical protein
MEAVEETIGAKAFSRACSLAPSYAAVQYFSVTNSSDFSKNEHGMHG